MIRTIFLTTSFLILAAGAASAQGTGSLYTTSTHQGDRIEIRLTSAILGATADLVYRP